MMNLLVYKDIMERLVEFYPETEMFQYIKPSIGKVNVYEIEIDLEEKLDELFAIVDIEVDEIGEEPILVIRDYPLAQHDFITIRMADVFGENGENIFSIKVYNSNCD